MKKFLCFFAAAAFILGTMTMTSCSKEDDEVTPNPTDSTNNNQNGNTSDASDLIGTWSVASEDFSTTYHFTETTMTRTTEWEKMEATYTYANGVLTLSNAKYYTRYEGGEWTPDGDEESGVTSTINVVLLQDKNVLVFRQQVQADEYNPAHEEVFCVYREGKTINVNSADLQGEWHWYMMGNTEVVRTLIAFDGNNYDLIITPWSQRYTGTYTIENGYLHFTPLKYYRCEWDGMNESDPRSNTWQEEDEEEWEEWAPTRMPFFVNGNEAYGIFANLPGLYVRQ